MNVLGLFGPGPNPSATLIRDGKVSAIVEEERLNRVKTAPHSIPIQAATECLRIGKLSLDDVDGIAYGWDCPRYSQSLAGFGDHDLRVSGEGDAFNALQERHLANLYHPVRIRRTLQLGLGGLSKTRRLPAIKYYRHHLCHAASAFYCSGFDEANVLTLDGSGEETSTFLARGSADGLEELKRYVLPDTLGGFYATFTEFMGFRPYQDEGKLMGLASYGKYSEELQEKLARFISWDRDSGDFSVNPRLRYVGEHTYGSRFTDEFVDLFGPKREMSMSALDGVYPDLAFAVQWRLEQIVISLARTLHRGTGLKRVCLAGGVAMNCVMNGRLAAEEFVDDIFVQPAASDTGVSLGAALLMAKEEGSAPAFRMRHLYYGPE